MYDWNSRNNKLSVAILEANHFESLLGELGCDVYPSKGGTEYRGPCPVHGGDNHNFQVWTNGAILPICWECHSRGCHRKYKKSLLGLVRGVLTFQRGKAASMFDAVSYLERFVKQMPAMTGPAPRTVRPAPNSFSLSREQVRRQLVIPSPYFLERGFSADILDFFDVGHSNKLNRAVVPLYDYTGTVCVGVIARDETGVARKKWLIKPDGFERGSYVYNFAAAATAESRTVLVVEGPGDVWKAAQAGVLAVSCLGCDVSRRQAAKLASLNKLLLIAFDNDGPGQTGARAAFKMVLSHTPHVRLAQVPGCYHDVGEMPAVAIGEWVPSLHARPVAVPG